MDILAIVFIWPIIIFALGLTFIAFGDFMIGGHGNMAFSILGSILSPLFTILFIILIFKFFKRSREGKIGNLVDKIRNVSIGFSLSLLFPIVVRYFIEATDNSLIGTIFGLIVGFTLVVSGMFMKRNKILIYSNILGGAMVLIYTYAQLWNLGEGARIIAAAFALIVAVVVSVLKLKDKLT